jgi:hypothetical protein
MRLLGLEPKTYGLKVRSDDSPTIANESTYDYSQNDLASCLALLAQTRPELAKVVEAWDTLPDAVRAGMIAMVNATCG